MFDGVVSPNARSAVVFGPDGADWRPRFSRTALCAALKRMFDVLAAGSLLLALLPVYAIISALIAADSPGPVLFRQKRTGLNGRIFVIYKFRTMRLAGTDVEVRHATQADDRVTRIGRQLRQSSLDEIPQLLNVLKGDMSLVGPRPHAVEHDIHYANLLPNYHERFSVRPGLTGLAQIQGLRGEIRDLTCMAHRVDADVLYAKHWSFPADLTILLRTVPLLLWRVNAY
ncbi:sugar transferase [Brevundimonas sp. TWP2-3-4b1]|uniref:sugar transferase n=1 Tax=Brevundimonas sp. TWP2-3-4b1 TaxID=2804580 RepID=UPI003CEEA0B1